MKNKIAWILFSVMTVVVIVLSSVMIAHSVKWKSGKELLKVNVEDVESATATLDNGNPYNDPITIQLDDKQITFVVKEFKSSMFERDNSTIDSGTLSIKFMLKDGSSRSFYMNDGCLIIDEKQYICHSYLRQYCLDMFQAEE